VNNAEWPRICCSGLIARHTLRTCATMGGQLDSTSLYHTAIS